MKKWIHRFNSSIHYDEQLPIAVISNAYRLKRILINLEGYVKLSVLLDQQKFRKMVVKFVADATGIGILADKKTLIYERFTKVIPRFI